MRPSETHDQDRRTDAVLAAAAASGPAASLVVGGFSLLAPVLVAVVVFGLVRFTRSRWQPLVIAAVVPEVAASLVLLRYPDDSEVSRYGERLVDWHLTMGILALLTAALVTAAGWGAARLRPDPDRSPARDR